MRGFTVFQEVRLRRIAAETRVGQKSGLRISDFVVF